MPTAPKPKPPAETAAPETATSVLHPDILRMLPDTSDPEFQARLKAAIAALDPEDEADAMRWIEAVSMFDNEDAEEQ
jgi:hypothetical protein